MKRLVISLALISLTSGCYSLPSGSVDSVHYQSSYPIGGSTIDASDVQITDKEVKIGKYTRKSRWWYFTQDFDMTGYVRDRKANEIHEVKTP